MNLLTKILRTGEATDFKDQNFLSEHFLEAEVEFYDYIKTYLTKYGKLPDVSTLETEFTVECLLTPEPLKYYADQFQSKVLHRKLSKSIDEISAEFDNPNGVDVDKIVKSLATTAFDLLDQAKHNKVYDFRESSDIVWEDYRKTLKNEHHGLELGWPYLDEMTGGLTGGDVVSIVGRPAMGKTFFMLYSANHVWTKQGKKPLVVSMEMNPLKIFQRMTCIYTEKTINHLRDATFSTKALGEMKSKLTKMKTDEVPFYLLHGNSKTIVEDIFIVASQLKPDIIYIDGAYMLRHKNQRFQKYDRVAENCDLIKFKLSTDLDIPVVCSYQFNRDAVKKLKKGARPGLENIAHADDIGQYSSLVLGTFEDETVETAKRRRIDILKGRAGETGEFHVNWDFMHMDFTQCQAKAGDKIEFF